MEAFASRSTSTVYVQYPIITKKITITLFLRNVSCENGFASSLKNNNSQSLINSRELKKKAKQKTKFSPS